MTSDSDTSDFLADYRQLKKTLSEERLHLRRNPKEVVVEVEVGGNAVTCRADGTRKVTEIRLDPACLDTFEPDLWEELVALAVNRALAQIDEEMIQLARPLPWEPIMVGGEEQWNENAR